MAKNKLDANAYGSWSNLITHVVLLVLAMGIYQNKYCWIMQSEYLMQMHIENKDTETWINNMRLWMLAFQAYLTVFIASVICTLFYMSKNKWFMIEMLATLAFVNYWVIIINLIVPEPKPTLHPHNHPDNTPDEQVYYNMPNQALCM